MTLAYIFWKIKPEIFTVTSGWLSGWSLRWYGMLFALGFLIGYYIMLGMFKREGKKETDLDVLTIWMVIGTIVGARLGHTLFYEPKYFLAHPIEILYIWQGGLASHGAALGILLVMFFYSRTHKDQPFLWVMDRLVITVALGGACIRLGNLMNSEIIGSVAHVPWAFVFTRVDYLPRHPSQLYEALFYIFSFVILLRQYRKLGATTPHGLIFGEFLVLIFGFRFFVEFLKETQVDWEKTLPLNLGQLLSIPFILLGIFLIVRARRAAAISVTQPLEVDA